MHNIVSAMGEMVQSAQVKAFIELMSMMLVSTAYMPWKEGLFLTRILKLDEP